MSLLFHTKDVRYQGRSVTIIQQNQNGPCPLIAICNTLALRDGLRWVPSAGGQLDLGTILNKLVGHLYEPSDESAQSCSATREHTLDDAIKGLPTLHRGLDVNVRFRNVEDYEFSPPMAVIDLLRIRLVHGWVVDPQNTLLVEAIGTKGYNQLQDMFLGTESMTPAHDAIKEFLSATASQLTTYGLFQLMSQLGEDELAMFFRSNHFSVITKHEGYLYTLVTDVGYQQHSNVVWERMQDAEGMSVLTDEDFCTPGESRKGRGRWDPCPPQMPPDVNYPTVRGTPIVEKRISAKPRQKSGQEFAVPRHPASKSSQVQKLPDPSGPCACLVS